MVASTRNAKYADACDEHKFVSNREIDARAARGRFERERYSATRCRVPYGREEDCSFTTGGTVFSPIPTDRFEASHLAGGLGAPRAIYRRPEIGDCCLDSRPFRGKRGGGSG